MNPHIARRTTAVVARRMAVEPVVALHGPRAVGKSTTLHEIAREHAVPIVDLDRPELREAVAADPAAFVAGSSLVCVDEFQKAPIVLDAIKAELNSDLRPGRFLITGSTRFDALPQAAQALTGRVHIVRLLPFSQGEIDGVEENFVRVAIEDPSLLLSATRSGAIGGSATRHEYVERVCRGGMPLAIGRSGADRDRWFDDYIRVSLERDVAELARIRRKAKLPPLLARLAGQTAQSLNMSLVARSVGLDPATAENYTKLLEDLFLLRRLPAWGRTLRSRATSAPKLHVLDSGVAAHLLRLTPDRLARLDSAALTEFGHLLETFVVGEIIKQVTWLDNTVDVGHWRTRDGDEVDLVLERRDGGVIGIEVKAGSRVTQRDGRGLRKLRDLCGDSFAGGIVLTTGNLAYNLDSTIAVLPIDRLWKPQ